MLYLNESYLPIIAAAIVGFIAGFVWWGPIFGMKWAKLVGMNEKDIKKAKGESMAKPMIVMIIGNLLMACVLSILLISTGAANIKEALTLAFLVWLGFVATIGIGVVLWEKKPMALFWINSIGWLITISAMAIVLMMF